MSDSATMIAGRTMSTEAPLSVVWGELPRFTPHPLVRGGHAQTIVGAYLKGAERAEANHLAEQRRHRVRLDDGDAIIVYEDRQANWAGPQSTALLIHGLGGCHRSLYVARLSKRLVDRGWRVLRMDMRGFGSGSLEARHHTHAGRWQDIAAVIEHLLSEEQSISLVGFSMGANQTLKLLGCCDESLRSRIDRAIAVAPPLRLWQCAATLDQGLNRIYDWSFVRTLKRQVQHRRQVPGFVVPDRSHHLPGRLRAFDAIWTAPLCGFRDVADYYDQASSVHDLIRIQVPTLIVSANDDPIVPPKSFENLNLSDCVTHVATTGGGHLGYIGRRSADADLRWLDWRIIEQLHARLPNTLTPRSASDGPGCVGS